MLSKLTRKLNQFTCGLSPPSPSDDDDNLHAAGAMLAAPFLRRRQTPNTSTTTHHPYRQLLSIDNNDGDDDEVEKAKKAETETTADEETRLPCLAFPSLDGYKIFSLSEKRVFDGGDVRIPMACRRRYVASPYGGKVFVTDLNWRYSSRLVDPFSGEVTSLPDLPLPFSETEPTPCADDEPRRAVATRVTDDAFAWDFSPRGAILIARGDTAFSFDLSGAGGVTSWRPVHRSRSESAMTVNYRDGFFFVLERHSLRTTVIDAGTMTPAASIAPPPCRHDIDDAYLVASTDDVLLLVRRRRRDDVTTTTNREVFTHVYRARHNKCRKLSSSSSAPEWEAVTDIGDRAAFITRSHGFTIGSNHGGDELKMIQRNCVYVVTIGMERDDKRRLVVRHRIGVVRLMNTKLLPVPGLEGDVSSCLHERMLGMPHWIFRNSNDVPPPPSPSPEKDDDVPPVLYDDGGLPPVYDDDASSPSTEEPECLCYFC
uniref:KIB1-4 beta-propeller domain-containing protein n=1 Tax=Leersia perrieri TaxID=77586 RepID=A0A0D9X581_9ORYZ